MPSVVRGHALKFSFCVPVLVPVRAVRGLPRKILFFLTLVPRAALSGGVCSLSVGFSCTGSRPARCGR